MFVNKNTYHQNELKQTRVRMYLCFTITFIVLIPHVSAASEIFYYQSVIAVFPNMNRNETEVEIEN